MNEETDKLKSEVEQAKTKGAEEVSKAETKGGEEVARAEETVQAKAEEGVDKARGAEENVKAKGRDEVEKAKRAGGAGKAKRGEEGSKMKSGEDVVTFLKGQHAKIKSLFDTLFASSGAQRKDTFRELRRLLAIHETAEEEIVHPAARRLIADGEAIVEYRLREERSAKEALAYLEKIDLQSTEFEARLRTLQEDVLEHAKSEEEQEFAQLAGKLDETRLQRMRKAVELAEKTAPTRPHPAMESAAANLFIGPFASMMDRARDALSKS
jgi:hemerythrin superfamily protein